MSEILKIIKDSINNIDPGYCLKELSALYVDQNNQRREILFKEIISEEFGFNMRNALRDTSLDYFELRDDFLSFAESVGKRRFLIQDSYWYFGLKGNAWEEMHQIECIEKQIYHNISDKNVHEASKKFDQLILKHLECQRQDSNGNKFSRGNLLSIGVINEDNEFTKNKITNVIDEIMKEKVDLNLDMLIRRINAMFKTDNMHVFNKMIEMYGELEKNGNALLLDCICTGHYEMIDWLIPKLSSFEVIFSTFGADHKTINKDKVSAFEIADLYCSKDVVTRLKEAQENVDLKKLIKVKPRNEDRLSVISL